MDIRNFVAPGNSLLLSTAQGNWESRKVAICIFAICFTVVFEANWITKMLRQQLSAYEAIRLLASIGIMLSALSLVLRVKAQSVFFRIKVACCILTASALNLWLFVVVWIFAETALADLVNTDTVEFLFSTALTIIYCFFMHWNGRKWT